MEKETYDLDDILSEVRERRQKQEKAENNTPAPEAEPKPQEHTEQEKMTEIEEKTEITESSLPELRLFEKTSEESIEITQPTPKEKTPDIIISDESDAQAPTDAITFEEFFAPRTEEQPPEKQEQPKKKQKFRNTKTGKIMRALIIILLAVILVFGVFGGIYVYKSLNQITDNNDTQQEEQWKGMGRLVENFPAIEETDASEIASLQDMVKTWYYNGDKCSSTHVLNVLLLGEDTRGDNILEEGTRADSSIIVSINIDTGEIILTSVLRDAYAYWETTKGDAETGMLGKINGSMSRENCSVHTYINCIESLYKIDIDNYVIVNFSSFRKIVDAMGGVTLELTSLEINEINNNPNVYGDVYIEKTFEGDSGEMLLTGKQALAYCRIRHIDSDNMRADRQKTCLIKIFEQAQGESKSTLLKMVNAMLPYVKTGFSKKEIVSIAKYAFSQGWLDYDITMTSVPYARINERGMGDINYGEWMWRPDYPQDAHYLQTLIYGKTNIKLAQTRVDVVNCENYGYYGEGSYPVTATIYNSAYGEPTTYETATKQDDTSTSN